jgi:6,7-dimethyl-8-ribityllumazine synthase
MPNEFDGTSGPLPSGRIAIVVSKYNASITGNLLQGALDTLRQAGFADDRIDVAHVPGAWEVPGPVAIFAKRPTTLAVIALAAVIRGETTHDQHLNRAVSNALMEIALEVNKPVLMGVLTCNTVEQAIHRSGGNFGNKGTECAEAALEMIRLHAKLVSLTQ